MKTAFTREEVLKIIDNLLQRPDLLIYATQNENTVYDERSLLEISESDLYPDPTVEDIKEDMRIGKLFSAFSALKRHGDAYVKRVFPEQYDQVSPFETLTIADYIKNITTNQQ